MQYKYSQKLISTTPCILLLQNICINDERIEKSSEREKAVWDAIPYNRKIIIIIPVIPLPCSSCAVAKMNNGLKHCFLFACKSHCLVRCIVCQAHVLLWFLRFTFLLLLLLFCVDFFGVEETIRGSTTWDLWNWSMFISSVEWDERQVDAVHTK